MNFLPPGGALRRVPLRPGLRARAAVLAVAACLALGGALPSPAAEAPPAQGTQLHFRKTLFVHDSPQGKVFAETRRMEKETSLSELLAADYRVSEEALPSLRQAFRKLNPGVDPERIPAGKTVRVPFKIEEGLSANAKPGAAPASAAAESSPQSYTVRAGDSLWRILANRFRVARDDMGKAISAVAKANPRIRDLNHLEAGQTLVVPLTGIAAPEMAGAAPGTAPAGPSRPLLALLGELGCQVATTGQTFLPVARGKTLRLDARELPVISGPSGRRLVLDPAARLSPPLIKTLEDSWGYAVLQGTEPDADAWLAKALPRLGFRDLREGPDRRSLARGLELAADVRWTVTPREEDLWEGRIHLLFPAGATFAPDVLAVAVRAGYSLHVVSGAVGMAPVRAGGPAVVPRVPEVPMADPARGEAALLRALGVSHRVRPEVECDLGGGVLYRLRPEITFEQGGVKYAVPPPEPRRAEALLTRSGFFTIQLADAEKPVDRLADLLALLKVPARRVTVEVPEGQSLRLRVEGLALDSPGLAARLYPGATLREGTKVLLTSADLSGDVAVSLLKSGIAPWVVRDAASVPERVR